MFGMGLYEALWILAIAVVLANPVKVYSFSRAVVAAYQENWGSQPNPREKSRRFSWRMKGTS